MNFSKKFPLVLVVILLGISLSGIFEEKALTFVSSVFEKNLKFMALTSEIKLVISGLSSMKLPILEGITADINNGLTKVIEYLLITDIISFFQVMLLSISKSWILKSITLILFLLSFVDTTKAICTKLVVLSLSLSPGLAIYSLGVQQLAQETSIDFGEKYLGKLEAQVNAVKSNKVELMRQHQSDLTKIKNGQKGIHILQKFRENVSYDFKKVKNEIKGAHADIRLFIHEAGHEMKSKIYGFCSMVLFCMLILPLGYVLIIYMLIGSLFNINSTHLAALGHKTDTSIEKKPDKPNLGQKLKRVFSVYLEEFHSIENKADNSGIVQKVKSQAEELGQKVVSKVKGAVGDEMEDFESKVTEEGSHIMSEATEKVAQEKDKAESEATSIKTEVKSPTNKDNKGGKPNTLSI